MQPSRFPHPEVFRYGDQDVTVRQVMDILGPMVSEERKARFDQVLAERTYDVVPVVEGLYDLGNVSAVMRSAEALGFQAIHVIESMEKFKHANRVSQGAEKWLDVSRWPDTPSCIAGLHEQGYRVIATHVDASQKISELDFTEPTALVFGNESEGISDQMRQLSDGECVIPMVGFVESFNISVAAAIALHHAYEDRMRRQGFHGTLTEEEIGILKAIWCQKTVRAQEMVVLDALKGE